MSISEAVLPPTKKREWVRYVLRLLAWFFGILLAVLTILGIYLYCNRDEIKRLFVEEINRNLTTPVSVRDVRLEAWREFPLLAISFVGVSASGSDESDEEKLFDAESIALQFNLWDIFQERYIVREISIRGGDFNIKHYGNGVYNYVIWHHSDSSSRSVSFHLRRVLLRNTLVRYRDLPGKHDFQLLARDVAAKGDLYENGQEFQLKGEVDVHSMKSAEFEFLSRRKAALDVRFTNDDEREKFTVQKGLVEIENIAFATTGFVRYSDEDPYMDFAFDGKNLRTETLLDLLPADSRAYLEDYTFKGRLSFHMNIKGNYTKVPLAVAADFSYNQGQIRHRKTDLSASDVVLHGRFSNNALVLDTLFARLPGGSLMGRFSILDFKKPNIRYEGAINADLAQLQDFLKILPEMEMQGRLQSRLLFSHAFAALDPEKWTAADFFSATTKGFLRLQNFHLKLADQRQITTDSLYVEFTPKVTRTKAFRLKMGESEFRLRLFAENLLPYLFLDEQKLYVTARLQSKEVDWDKLTAWMFAADQAESKKDTAQGFLKGKNLLKDLSADVDLSVDKLRLEEVNFEHLSGSLHYDWENTMLEDLRFDALQGSVEGGAAMNRIAGGKKLSVQGKMQNIDISACFKAFKNFGQDELTHRNIGGSCSAEFHASANYADATEKIDLNSVQLWAKLDIAEGSLQHMEGLKKVARFTGEDDLQNIRFSRLQNVIEIKESCIYIPDMQVRSTAADFLFRGTHKFNNEVDYLLDIELSDLLSRRRTQRLKAKQESEFGVVTGGKSRLRLPLHIKGVLPNPEIKYALSIAKKDFKEQLKENRNELREALNEEYSNKQKKRNELREGREDFLIDFQDEEINAKNAPKAVKTDTVKKKSKYKTEEDFRMEFEEE